MSDIAPTSQPHMSSLSQPLMSPGIKFGKVRPLHGGKRRPLRAPMAKQTAPLIPQQAAPVERSTTTIRIERNTDRFETRRV